MTVALALRAWLELLYLDLVALWGFRAIRHIVLRTPTSPLRSQRITIDHVVTALGTAHLVYFKKVHCLQRSVAVTRLLRWHGVPAHLIIGCHPMPIQAHAWVEVDGRIVSDYQHGVEHFHILDRW